MRRVALTLLASLGVAAGLAVTASSTSAQAYEAGMRGLALAAIVVVLEVVNTLGTWVWLSDPRPHARWQAGALVGCASLVTAWCGALTYGPVGLVGPFFVLAGVHLASLAATTPTTGADPVTTPAAHPDPVVTPTPDPGSPDESNEGPEEENGAGEDAPDDAPGRPVMTDDDILAALRSRPTLPGRDAVRNEFRVGTKRAERVLADARRPALVKEVAR